jgi:lipopolysaccharide export system permease protein
MKILDKYIIKKFIANLIVGMFGTIVIFFSFDFFQIIERVTSGKMSFIEVPMVTLQSIPSIISYEMMHLAALIGSLLTMSDMNVNLELVALKSSGINFRRIILGPVVISAILATSMFLFTEFVSVYASKEKREINNRIEGRVISRNLDDIYYKSGDRFYYISNVNGYSNNVTNIQYVDMKENKVIKIVNAPVGTYLKDKNIWILERGFINDIVNNKTEYFESMEADIKEPLDRFLEYEIIRSFDSDFGKDLSFQQIKSNIKFLQASGGNYMRLLTHVHHQRLAYPFSVFIMAIIGLSLLSQYSRAGKGKAITLGILLGFGYYVIFEICKAMGFGATIPMVLSAWLPNIAFSILAIYFFIQASK